MILHGGDVGGGSVDVGDIGHSLRFRSSASAYLSRTFVSVGNRKTWTWSGWVKRGTLGGVQSLFGTAGSSTDTTFLWFGFNASDKLTLSLATGVLKTTSAVYRDPTAHLHVVVVFDTSQATGTNRVKFYINGQQVMAFDVDNPPTQNVDHGINLAQAHYVSTYNGSGYPLDGYLSRVCFVDGQALTPSSFGYLNSDINEWVTKSQSEVKAVVDAGGSNSFMLDFDNGTSLTTLGNDKSAKGNNWTLNNISLTAGTTYDWMLDVPGNSYCTLNPLKKDSAIANSEANFTWSYSGSGGPFAQFSTIGLSSGSWYWEVLISTQDLAGADIIGVSDVAIPLGRAVGQDSWSYGYSTDGLYRNNNGSTSAGTTASVSDVLMKAFDATNGKLWVGKNGTWFGSGNPAAGTSPAFSGIVSGTYSPSISRANTGGSYASTFIFNFGQRPFAYTPPTGFKALCQANLPEIPSATRNPLNHVQVKLDTGANIKATCEAVFPSNCFEWIKDRANSNNHQLLDIVRGLSSVLQSNTTAAETTYTAPSGSSVGLVLKAGGAPVTNTAGTITSQVSANRDAGFSIVKWTGNGVGGATVGHGLSVTPRMIVVKSLSNGTMDWMIYHSDLGATKYVLFTTGAAGTSSSPWNNTSPTSSVFSLGASANTNQSGNTFVAYCFCDNRDLPGGIFRCFSYTGNGNADGSYVDLGGKSLWTILKSYDNGGAGYDWKQFDSVRDMNNPLTSDLTPNSAAAEGTGYAIDDLSQGLKFRGTQTTVNYNGNRYIGLAIIGTHGKYS